MKYRKRLAYLKARQDWWDKQGKDYQAANKKPGSVKVRQYGKVCNGYVPRNPRFYGT